MLEKHADALGEFAADAGAGSAGVVLVDGSGEGSGDGPEGAVGEADEAGEEPEGAEAEADVEEGHRGQLLFREDDVYSADQLVDVCGVLADVEPMGEVGDGEADVPDFKEREPWRSHPVVMMRKMVRTPRAG